MADDEQQPGPSQVKVEPETKDSSNNQDEKPQADEGGPSSEQPATTENVKPEGGKEEPKGPVTGRKRKLSAKRANATNKRGGQEGDNEQEDTKLKFLLDPVLSALGGLEDKDEVETMRTLISTLQPTQKEVETALNRVKADLDRVLGFNNNSYVVYDFGSIKSGLAFRDSDLDFYIHYEKNSESKQEQTKLIHVIYGRMTRDPRFHSLVKILSARVPLLRAIHGPTNLTCDINFSNARGCYNSKFIYAVTRFDTRIHKLAIIIKFWAKCAYLLNDHRQMNTYCIIMMLIFYLQTKKLPLLPSVQDLQKGIPRVNYGPWNLGYPREISFQTMNNESIRSLLTNFFKYYATFEFHANLISPFVGRVCTIEEMKQQKVRELQPYYRAEQQDFPMFNYGTLISIQDPFELNMNVGGVCNSAAHLEQMKVSFKAALEACNKTQAEPFAQVLEAVFTKTKRYTKPRVVGPSKQPGANKNGAVPPKDNVPDASTNWRLCRLLPAEYELFMVSQMLQKTADKDKIITDAQIRERWADCVLDFIEDILEKIYLCKVTTIENAERAASIPVQVQTGDIRTFELCCERQVILKRSRLQIDNEAQLNREIAVSKARWELDRPMVFTTRVDMFKTPNAVEFHIGDEQRKNGQLRLFIETCFLTQIRNCVKGYLKVMLAKAEKRSRGGGAKVEPAADVATKTN